MEDLIGVEKVRDGEMGIRCSSNKLLAVQVVDWFSDRLKVETALCPS